MIKNKKPVYKLGASIICANFINLEKDLQLIKKGGADYIHFDVMDGQFVPRFGLPPEYLKSIKNVCKLPVYVHMMIANPEPYLKNFTDVGADMIVVHTETCQHLHRTIQMIKSLGALAGVAINPATPLNVLDYVLDDLSLVVIMAINPGIVGHKFIPNMFNKIKELKDKIKNNKNLLIEVDGGVTFETSPELIKAGADALVCGSSTIFNQTKPIDKQLIKLRKKLDILTI